MSTTPYTPVSPNTACPACGSDRVVSAVRGAKLGMACTACGGWAPWRLEPWTLERAQAAVIPHGRYQGRTVGDVWAADEVYVRMLANRDDRGSLTTAARWVVWEADNAALLEADDIPF